MKNPPKKLPRLKLPDDPHSALLEISKYLNSIVITKERRVPTGANEHEFEGYWQTFEYIYGLQAIASEAERIARQK